MDLSKLSTKELIMRGKRIATKMKSLVLKKSQLVDDQKKEKQIDDIRNKINQL